MKTLKITTQESEHEIIHHIQQKSNRILLFFVVGLVVFGVVLGVLVGQVYSAIFFMLPISALVVLLSPFALKTIITIDRASGQFTAKRMFLTHCYHSRQFFLHELAEVRYFEVPWIESGDMTYLYLIDAEEKRYLLYRHSFSFGELKSFGENLAKELRLPFTSKGQ